MLQFIKEKVILDVLKQSRLEDLFLIPGELKKQIYHLLKPWEIEKVIPHSLIRFFEKFYPKKHIVPARRQGQCL